MTNSVINRIDQRLAELDPDEPRAKILLALRQFRSSWIELGRLLSQIAYDGDYKDWGYDDFEMYCAKELGLKRPTVQKLILSYNYMKKHEPKRLEAWEVDSSATLPDYQTVDMLNRMRTRADVDDDDVESLHRRAFEGEEDETSLRKEIRRTLLPRSEESISSACDERQKQLRSIVHLARQLRIKIAESKECIPAGIRSKLEECLVTLESLD